MGRRYGVCSGVLRWSAGCTLDGLGRASFATGVGVGKSVRRAKECFPYERGDGVCAVPVCTDGDRACTRDVMGVPSRAWRRLCYEWGECDTPHLACRVASYDACMWRGET